MDYGIHSDGTRFFREPMEPNANDEVSLRLRIKEGYDAKVVLHYKIKDERSSIAMEFSHNLNKFDYYEAKLQLGEDRVSYYYEIQVDSKVLYFNFQGVRDKHPEDYYNHKIYPGFKTPKWAKEAVLYQIFPDRFCNGDLSNDTLTNEYNYMGKPVKRIEDWEAPVEPLDVYNFYGGDLQGIMSKLTFLKKLGIDGIYLNPIFVSPSNHKYDIQDYDYVDPHLAVVGQVEEDYAKKITSQHNLEESNKLFATFVKKAHELGIKVILDGVFNHCGSFNKWMDSYNLYGNDTLTNPENKYREFFKFGENNDYEQWWGNDTLPKLNYENSTALVEQIYEIGKKWVRPPYNIDGWRLDVAADLGHSEQFNHEFWKGFRREVKSVNPECLILAEHYGDPAAWLGSNEWDSIMNYDAFMEPVTWFLTGMEKHSDEYRGDLYNNADAFWSCMVHYSSRFPTQSIYCAMNQLSNHDHSRFLTRTNKKVGRVAELGHNAASEGVDIRVLMEAVVIQMTWVGSPTLYYGEEVGLCGFTDPDNRRTYPWGREDKNILAFYKAIIKLRKRFKRLFTTGSIKELYRGYGVIAYARFTDKEVVVVCINNMDKSISFELPLWKCGCPKDRVMYEEFQTGKGGYNRLYNAPHRVEKDSWIIRIGERSTRIFRYKLD